MQHSERDELIDRVRYGRLTPAEAEAEAAHLGLERLASRPDPSQFEPMPEPKPPGPGGSPLTGKR
jgi:hypothetical protein